MKSQLILNNRIVKDDWETIMLPKIDVEVKKQAGKVVMFKLTGDNSPTPEQVDKTKFSNSGNVILPMKVFLKHKIQLQTRLKNKEIGIWIDTHEEIESFIEEIEDINAFPIFAIRVGKFADGRIFSIGSQLRTKFKYKNILRAFGDVLRDQLFFLKRTGFDSYLIREDRNANDALNALKDFTLPYQGSINDPMPAWKKVNRDK
jgi:uncharacterized protein (DUF934 family)|tara:strand:+ start:557 stop:1165 length:609 start_codon:yes stop_codon:yes gene_type:complete